MNPCQQMLRLPLTARLAALLFLCAVCAVSLAGAAADQDLVFETDRVRYVVGDNGTSKSLQLKATGRELLAGPPAPMATIRWNNRYFPATSARKNGGLVRVEFGGSGVWADYRYTAERSALIIELAQLGGAGVQEARLLQLRPGGLANAGTLLPVIGDKEISAALAPLDDRVDARFGEGMLLASVSPEYGMIGTKAALVAVPPQEMLPAMEELERTHSLPSPKIGGEWAKSSFDSRTSYLFADLTEANVDEMIGYAKLGGFRYILIYASTWSSSYGSHPVNLRNFPRGEAGLKAVIDKCRAAGLKTGMHVLTSFVSKNDAIARETPLFLAGNASAVLAKDLTARDREIVAKSGMAHFSGATDIRIDDEIIRYEAVGGPGSTMLLRCTRGIGGTKPAPHQADAKIVHLAEYDGAYLADLRTPLADRIADRLAGLIDRCGFDMVYFDGAEANCVNGPCWYWAGRQQLAVWKRVKRDLLVQGSAVSPWLWHIASRGTCDDYAAVAPKEYLDHYKIPGMREYYAKSFLPSELGWWGFFSAAPDYPATMPDEIELLAARMLGLDSPASLETNLSWLRGNGRTGEMLGMLGRYEDLRLRNSVPPATRAKLRTGEWRLTLRDGKPRFAPVVYDRKRMDLPGEGMVRNPFAKQQLQFRLRAEPLLAAVGDKANRVLLGSDAPLALKAVSPKTFQPGTLAGKIDLIRPASGLPGKPMDLTRHRALAVRLAVDGPPASGAQKPAVLNVQLESGGAFYRDHYIDIDSRGERTVILPEPSTERLLPEFGTGVAGYAFKSAMQGFDYRNITAVNLRWMRLPAGQAVSATVLSLEALEERDTVLTDPILTVGGRQVRLPVTLRTGDYLEYRDEGPARVFDRNNNLLATVVLPDLPIVESGEDRVLLEAGGKGAAVLTVILSGEPAGD